MNEFPDNGEGVSNPMTLLGTYYQIRHPELSTPIPPVPCGWLQMQDESFFTLQDGSRLELNCGMCNYINVLRDQNNQPMKFQNGDCFDLNP